MCPDEAFTIYDIIKLELSVNPKILNRKHTLSYINKCKCLHPLVTLWGWHFIFIMTKYYMSFLTFLEVTQLSTLIWAIQRWAGIFDSVASTSQRDLEALYFVPCETHCAWSLNTFTWNGYSKPKDCPLTHCNWVSFYTSVLFKTCKLHQVENYFYLLWLIFPTLTWNWIYIFTDIEMGLKGI